MGMGARNVGVGEIMSIDLESLALAMPLPPAILVRANQFLPLGVHGNDGDAGLHRLGDGCVDVLELSVAVGMPIPLKCLLFGFAACAEASDNRVFTMTDRVKYSSVIPS
jgi:hypothetical protein